MHSTWVQMVVQTSAPVSILKTIQVQTRTQKITKKLIEDKEDEPITSRTYPIQSR